MAINRFGFLAFYGDLDPFVAANRKWQTLG
jgi:hypothetical protein